MAPSRGVKREFRSFVPTPRRLVVSKRLVGNTLCVQALAFLLFQHARHRRTHDGIYGADLVETFFREAFLRYDSGYQAGTERSGMLGLP